MTWVDVVILVVVGLSAFISLLRGFLREAVSLAGWILAIWVALSYTDEVASLLADHVEAASIRQGIAFVALFVSVLIGTALANYLLGLLVDKTGLTGTDRVLGVVFGIARGVLVVVILVVLAGLTDVPQDPWWQESMLLPRFEIIALDLKSVLPPDVAERLRY